MKKKLLLVIALLFVFANVVHASVNGTFKGYDIIKVYSGDQELIAANPAILVEGTTMVPIRMLEQLGFTIEWDGTAYSVTVTPPDPIIVEVPVTEPSEEPTEPVEGPKEPTKPVGESNTPSVPSTPSQNPPSQNQPSEEPVIEEPPTEEPIEEEPVVEEPVEEEPTEPAVCGDIRNEYAAKIAHLSYEGLTQGKYNLAKHMLEYERDQKLAENGCS